MNISQRSRAAFTLSLLLIAFSVTAGAGTYEVEMVNMGKAIAASFDQKQQIRTIAVLDFTDLQGTVTELGRFLAEELSADLVIGQKQFDVIDRANLKRLLDENKLSRSGLVSPEAIKRLGKMAGADALVTGMVTPMGNSLRVSARIINTETARIVGAAQVNIDKTPEMSELLRARVVESGSSGTGAVSSIPTDRAGVPTRKVKLTYEDKLFRATVASAFFDKSSNRIKVFIDFVNLFNGPLCLATAGSDSIVAIDDFAGQWNEVEMVGIRQGEFLDTTTWGTLPPAVYNAAASKAASTWREVALGASYRFGIVLAPTKADSSLTLNLIFGLLVVENPGLYVGGCKSSNRYNPMHQASIGFDGIVATK